MENKKDKDIKWMYEGPKSLVNREDYLLGKKIDKNFELFSDVVVKDKDEPETRFTQTVLNPSNDASASSLEILGLDVVRTEDPLVAIRMKKEQRKRAILEDPLLKLKAQRILREAYEKEFGAKKHGKKKSKRSKRSSSRLSSSSDLSSKRQKLKHDSSHRETKKHSKHKYRSRSPSPSSSTSHQRKHSDKTQKERPTEKVHEMPSDRKSHSKQKLSKEEMEAKRRAMMSNVQWRDDIRNKTIENVASKLRSEELEVENSRGNGIAPLIGNVMTASSSMEERLQSKKHTLQRSHNYMEKSFARK